MKKFTKFRQDFQFKLFLNKFTLKICVKLYVKMIMTYTSIGVIHVFYK